MWLKKTQQNVSTQAPQHALDDVGVGDQGLGVLDVQKGAERREANTGAVGAGGGGDGGGDLEHQTSFVFDLFLFCLFCLLTRE